MRKFIKNKLSIIIPTYNEEKNISKLINEILQTLNKYDLEIIIVDDGSQDKTVEEVIETFNDNNKVRIIQRESDKGLIQSVKFALQTISGEFFLVMDGDGQHSPSDIVKLLKSLESNDLAIGIRDLNTIDTISKKRLFLSKIFNKVTSFILGRTISDPLTGFFAGKVILLNEKFFLLKSSGFKVLLDLIFCNKKNNIKISEQIIEFKKRLTGFSKLNLQVGFSFFTQIISYLFNGLISSKFIGFVIIGGFGFILHFVTLYMSMKYFLFSFYTSHILSTLITSTLNFILNNFLNFFDNEIKTRKAFTKGLIKYYLINLPGILTSIGGASFAYNVLNKNPFVSSFLGVILDTVFKYIVSKTWIWKQR